ncbi:MAG: DUF4249 domain-containing protein [Panacibacter sp.]
MKALFFFFILLLTGIGCKEVYNAPLYSPPTGFLVVEGFINSGQGATVITLTRTTKLYDSVDIIYEHNALVTVEGENNESFPLYESTNGTYLSASLSLNSAEKYRLHIKTIDGKEYASDFSTVKSTPDIDSISWQRESGGVQTYINAHDAANSTKYYQWKYEETWEFHSTYLSSLNYIYDPVKGNITGVEYKFPNTHDVDTTIYKCWKTVNSSSIIIGSTEKLSQDIIYLPLIYVEPQSQKMSVLYSVNLRQYALSHEAYLFYQKIKKNTEQLGSVFDPQPSDLQGNIHCITNPTEIVVGFVEVTQEKQKRIFIKNSELPDWNYNAGCLSVEVDNNEDSILKYASGLLPTIPSKLSPRNEILSFYVSYQNCIDCTVKGTNVRPLFWP